MLPGSNRLDRRSFNSVFSKSRSVHGKFFSLRIVRGAGNGKFSVVVPKAIAKTAVKRNKLRRRGYEAIQAVFPDMPQGVSGIIFFKKDGVGLTFPEIKNELTAALGKFSKR